MATVPGRYLIIDTGGEPPVLIQTDDLLPTVLAERLDSIDAKLGLILMSMAEQQANLNTLTDGMTSVATQLSAAQQTLAAWIAEHQSAPLDFTPAMNALASVTAAAGTMDQLLPQAPSDPIQPVPAPPDPAPDPSTPITDPGTPDLPPDTGIDPGTAADASGSGDTTVTDTGGASDTLTTDTGTGPDSPPAPAQF